MFEYVGINLGLCWPQLGVAPILMAEGVIPRRGSTCLSGPIFGGPSLRRDDGLCITTTTNSPLPLEFHP